MDLSPKYLPLLNIVGPIAQTLDESGLRAPTRETVWEGSERSKRSEVCSRTLAQQQFIKDFWKNFEAIIESRQAHGLILFSLGRSIDVDTLHPTTEDAVWSKLMEGYQHGGRRAVLQTLARMCALRLHNVLSKTSSTTVPSHDEHAQPTAPIDVSVEQALNTSLSYLFGAPHLIDALVEGTMFERDGDAIMQLNRQFQSFLRFFSGLGGGIEHAFQEAVIPNARVREALFLTFNFDTQQFSLLENNGSPVLAFSKEALDRVLKDNNTHKGPRLGCPALFAGVLPQYFSWVNSILEHYYWDFDRFDAQITRPVLQQSSE